MTTIVYDGKNISADSRGTYTMFAVGLNPHRDDQTKIFLFDQSLLTVMGEQLVATALAGGSYVNSVFQMLHETPKECGKMDHIEIWSKDIVEICGDTFNDATILLVTKKNVYLLDNGKLSKVTGKFTAIGSGSQYIPKFMLGYISSSLAVEVAAKKDKFTGGPVKMYNTLTPEKGVNVVNTSSLLSRLATAAKLICLTPLFIYLNKKGVA